MNPRVSRSSALASKATGLPDREACGAAGGRAHARRAAERHHGQDDGGVRARARLRRRQGAPLRLGTSSRAEATLGSEMRAVGEALGLGRTFPEAFLKALEGREQPAESLPGSSRSAGTPYFEARRARRDPRRRAAPRRRAGTDPDRAASGSASPTPGSPACWWTPGGRGALAGGRGPGGSPSTPARPSSRPDAVLLPLLRGGRRVRPRPAGVRRSSARARTGSVRGSSSTTAAPRGVAFRKLGYEAVLLNSNPETVSTDYDTSDRLYLEPLTLERVLDVCELEQPLGVVVTLAARHRSACARVGGGGRAAPRRSAAGDRARRGPGRFGALLVEPGARAVMGDAEKSRGRALADRVGYPRARAAHHVLGGRGMRVVQPRARARADEPVLVDAFLEGALELDVDCLCDGEEAGWAAILEHVEPAGVHSGDSACVLPSPRSRPALEAEIRGWCRESPRGLGVRGLLNLQLALRDGDCTSSRRTRAPPARCRSSRRRSASRLVDHAWHGSAVARRARVPAR